MKHLVESIVLSSMLVGAGCRLDPGTPDYSGHVGLVDRTDAGGSTELLGPDPYVPGEARLAFGLFYEGGRSEEIVINGTTINYYIFVDGSDRLTYEQDTSEDRIEGKLSDRFTLEGTSFWGGGFVWTEAIDLSQWSSFSVSFKSSDPSFETFGLELQSGAGAASTIFDPRDYGYVNDGEWHTLVVPLQDAIDIGFDPTQVRSPFIVAAAGGDSGDVLLIDNLYYSKD